LKTYRNNEAVWNKTSELMSRLKLPFLEAHRRAQAIVALDELKDAIRGAPSLFSKRDR